ncbi:MAG TPA: serpin family protein, partial [Labilithrix sp.]|nr:serpin family protein [Labilithrix sp.]
MSLLRALPWVSIGVGLLACEWACEPASSGRTSSPPPQSSEVGPATTAMPDASTTKADVSSSTVKITAAELETPPTTAEVTGDVRNANGFTFKALARMKKPAENVMISGTSVRLALGTTYIGARGPTAREMAVALSLDNDPKIAARLAHAELGAWQEARGS